MSFRNRCVIGAANGPVNLTVPIQGGRNQKALMRDVRILNSDNWQTNHWRTITSAYNRSPWFHHFSHELEMIYTSRFDRLVDWNMACFKWACDKMAISTPIGFTKEYIREYDHSQFEDWRGKLRPSTITSVKAEHPMYTQVFADRYPFVPHLSILDYIFCVGPR